MLYYQRNKDPSSWTSYSGMQTQYNFNNVQSRKLKRIIPHPLYDHMTSDYDIALLELSEPLQFANTIQPICLPDSSHVFPAGMSCWVTGWGALREGGIINVMVILWTTVVILNLILKKSFMYLFVGDPFCFLPFAYPVHIIIRKFLHFPHPSRWSNYLLSSLPSFPSFLFLSFIFLIPFTVHPIS